MTQLGLSKLSKSFDFDQSEQWFDLTFIWHYLNSYLTPLNLRFKITGFILIRNTHTHTHTLTLHVWLTHSSIYTQNKTAGSINVWLYQRYLTHNSIWFCSLHSTLYSSGEKDNNYVVILHVLTTVLSWSRSPACDTLSASTRSANSGSSLSSVSSESEIQKSKHRYLGWNRNAEWVIEILVSYPV